MTGQRVALLLAVIGGVAGGAAAQDVLPDSSAPVVAPRLVAARFAAPHGDSSVRRPALLANDGVIARGERPRAEWWAPIASAIIPGAGQARLQQDRFVGYLAVEGFLWSRYLVHRRQGIDERREYRDLALRVSRAEFPGPKPQGDFEYYERMEHWIASGIYDLDPGPALAPETDTTTFNGAMWLLARRTYWPSPNAPPAAGSEAYAAALRFYQRYAVPSEFQWSWRQAPLHQDVYRQHIRASNDAFRRTITDVGAVIANHVLSTVDAYVSLRLRFRDTGVPGGDRVELSTSVPLETLGTLARRARRSPRE